jgi:hypothetical protein
VARDTISDTLAEQDAEEDDQGAQAGDHTAGRNQRSEVDEQSDDEDSQEQDDDEEDEGDDADEVCAVCLAFFNTRSWARLQAPSAGRLISPDSHISANRWYYYRHQYNVDFTIFFAMLISPRRTRMMRTPRGPARWTS